MQGGYKVITLCGSTKFEDEFLDIQARLTLAGNIVISVGVMGHTGDADKYGIDYVASDEKIMLDDIHKRKIDMSDAIFVINKDGYLGDSTISEIAYAREHGKDVLWLEPEHALSEDGKKGAKDMKRPNLSPKRRPASRITIARDSSGRIVISSPRPLSRFPHAYSIEASKVRGENVTGTAGTNGAQLQHAKTTQEADVASYLQGEYDFTEAQAEYIYQTALLQSQADGNEDDVMERARKLGDVISNVIGIA